MLRLTFVVIISIPYIIMLYAKVAYYDKHPDRFSEEGRYRYARLTCKRIQRNGNIRTKIWGKENLPKEGGYVMYPNHQGKYDAVGIVIGHEKPCTIVMDEVRSHLPIMNPFLKLIKGRTLDKSDVRSQAKTIKAIVEEVKEGRRYIIFPEGGYDHNGNKVQHFHSGAFKCSVRSKTPIVPVALVDSYKPFEINSLKKVITQVHFLEPILYEEYKDMTTEEIANMVRKRIIDVVEYQVEGVA